MAEEKCCGGRMGERICRARFCVPLSIVIVVIHFALWWYVIYPYFVPPKDSDSRGIFGPGYSDKAYMYGESTENYDASSREWDSTTDYPSPDSTTHEVFNSSADYLRQEFKAREIQRPPQHRLRHHNRHRYVVRRKKPYYPSYSTSTTQATYPRRILDNVDTRRDNPTSTWIPRTYPAPRTSPPSSTVNPTTLLTNLVVQMTTTPRHHNQHHRQHQHHHHHSTTTTTTTTTERPTPQFRHHHHFENDQNEELHRQRAALEREKERREQEKMRLLTEERARLRLTEEQERRAQEIFDQQQRFLKQKKEEELRKKAGEEEARRREEHERKLKQWDREDEVRARLPEVRPPAVHESNQWHHPDAQQRQQQSQPTPNSRDNYPQPQPPPLPREDYRQPQPSREPQRSSEVVADPWAHLQQVQEQRTTSVTVVPATRSPGISNEIDPFSITRHSIEEASGVWRGHVDHQNTHPNAVEHQRHHQHQVDEFPRTNHHHQHHHRHHHQQQPTPPPRPSEADARRQMVEDEARRQQEYEKRLQEWHRENQARQQSTTTTPSSEPPPPPHHHHYIQGSLPHQVHTGHHSHHKHQQRVQTHIPDEPEMISNEIAPPPVSREARDLAPVIVTALLDIGRGDWLYFTRPYDFYLSHLLDLLKLQNRFIIYGDSQVLETLKNHSDIVDMDRIQFISLSFDDLPYARYRNEIKEIMDDEQKNWKDTWEKSLKTHPETINPDYNILVNSKAYLLYNATQISRFDSEFFIWVDAGYSHGEKNKIPATLWTPSLPPGKITAIKLTPDQDKVTNYEIDHVYRKAWTVMSGGILAGDVPTIDRFRRFYHKTFMDLLDARKTDDDQTTLLITVANYHSLFNILTGGWFDAFKLLPSQ